MDNKTKQPISIAKNRRKGQSSPAEMEAFLASIGDAHPDQVMAGVGEGSLTRGIVVATFLTILLMAGLTAGPFYWNQYAASHPKVAAPPKEEAKPADATDAAASTDKSHEKSPTDKALTGVVATDAHAAAGQPAGNKKVLDKLGESEVKDASPDVNPLDSKIDDLMDNLK